MADVSQSADLNFTITALQQGLASVSVNDAIALIDSWQQELQGQDIGEDLGELKAALRSGNKSEISKILIDLGEDTSVAATDAPADVASKLQQLGQLLIQAGESVKLK
ncbi:hypothetical protein [Leptolyngbya sp. FACHB-261]|uniref:hypothetical protein n=1 Tax=Leptolyngbya sp. FACHB-261 TaxID=2692806 RepID=UPI001688F804|nr:hypothetical protein [Leptolyngbya sp. FACHB-261]MBD2099491.1 hypothetical protein [Leptolyngbya sp. FACHB-261]